MEYNVIRRDKLNPAGVRKDNRHPTSKIGAGTMTFS